MGNYFNIFRKEEPEKAPDDTSKMPPQTGVEIEVVCQCDDCRFYDGNGKCRFRKIVLASIGICTSYETENDDLTSNEE